MILALMRRKNDSSGQHKYLKSAIELTERAIKRTPLDPDVHFTLGKLNSFLDGK